MSNLELEQLIATWLDGRITEAESEALQDQLRASPEARATFNKYTQLDAVIRETADANTVAGYSVASGFPRGFDHGVLGDSEEPVAGSMRLMPVLAVAVTIIVALTAGLYFQHRNTERQIAEIRENSQRPVPDAPIAEITGLSGSLIWTGDRGQIVRELDVGAKLAGGTIEGMAPDSWFELQFNDGSTVMIAGASMLTFSDLGQKELRLKEGRLSADVVPQPEGKPMLIHTRSALLKVLGTQFEVEAELDSTSLHVSKGKVQIKRLSDGKTVDVPATHRVVASADGDMSPQPIPDAVHDWKSQLQLGLGDAWGNHGKWSPTLDGNPASLRAIPFVPRVNKSITLHLLGLPITRSDNAPVVVKSDSRFVVHGRLATAADVFFGIRVVRPNGEFAGKFLARQRAAKFNDDSNFEAVFRLDEFRLDPCVWNRKDELPSKPDNLVVTCVWSFTHTGGPTGLEVTEVELIPPDQQAAEPNSQ